MQSNKQELEKEFLKENNKLGVVGLIFALSFILTFFNIVFLLIAIISFIISIKFLKRIENIKKDLIENGIDPNLLLKKKDKNNLKEDKKYFKEIPNENNYEKKLDENIEDIKIHEEENIYEDDILNKKLIEDSDLYLKAFNDLPVYNLKKELDEKFINKIKRTKEVEYEKFIKPSGTTNRPMNFIVFDLETTGLNPVTNEIIEIGAIKFEVNEPVEIFHTFVKPKNKISGKITSINGITNEKVENSPSIEEIIPKFLDFIGEDVLIAHNSDFDMGFILNQLYKLGYKKTKNKVIDTLKLARQKVKEYDFETDRDRKLKSYKLESFKYALDLWELDSHNSIDDCKVCAYLYLKIKNEYGNILYI